MSHVDLKKYQFHISLLLIFDYVHYATEHIFPGLPTGKMVNELPW